MSWDDVDNKNYRGPKDDRLVSMSERYEVKYFIDDYLKSRNYTINDVGRDVIYGQMVKYPGPTPIVRVDLEKWLDTKVSRGK